MGSPIAITGLGCVSALGADCNTHLHALAAGSDGLGLYTEPRLPLAAHLPVGRVCTALPAGGRTAGLGLLAAKEALAELPPALGAETGLCVGTSTGGMPESERAYLEDDPETPHPIYRKQQAHLVGDDIASAVHLRGPRSTHSVACASAACALIEAVEWLRQGLVPRVLVVGTDALCRLTMAGFNSLKVVDPQGCRPFTSERAGMSLGEAGAALLLEDLAAAHARNATIHAGVLGWGLAADAHHPTAPDPAGTQLEAAINAALRDAQCKPHAIDYVNAHCTGTHDNDAVESTTLARMFGAIPTASSKRGTGHTMGAAAAVEAVVACLAIKAGQQFASAGANTGTPLPGIDLIHATRDVAPRTVLSTSLAFGGVNAAVLFGGADQCA